MFKGLLFMGAGAVLHATHERNMEEMGGLIHRMPWTAALFLIGCISISALPPFNGFVSEWLTFQAFLLSPALPQPAPETADSAGGRSACADRRARSRLFRQGLRGDFSGALAWASAAGRSMRRTG